MKAAKYYCLIFFFIPLITSSQSLLDKYRASFVSVDSSLTNNAEEWNIKSNGTAWNLPKTKFGPFETIKAEQSKKYRIASHKESSLNGSNQGTMGIVKTTNTADSMSYNLTVLYNAIDSIFIELTMITVSENKHETIQFGKNEQPEENSSSTYWDETFINFNNDSILWHMSELVSLENINQADSFEIKKANGFKIGKKRRRDVLGVTTGFVFLHDGIQEASVETYPEIYVWIRKDLNEEFKQVLGGAIMAILIVKPRE